MVTGQLPVNSVTDTDGEQPYNNNILQINMDDTILKIPHVALSHLSKISKVGKVTE